MNEKDFQRNLAAANTLKSAGIKVDFYTGYMRGLRRRFHGESFCTKEEHESFMLLADDADESRKNTVLGYRAGFEGITVKEILETE